MHNESKLQHSAKGTASLLLVFYKPFEESHTARAAALKYGVRVGEEAGGEGRWEG